MEVYMNVLIVGCGRVGANLANMLDSKGHQVTVIDEKVDAFDRLSVTFKGTTIRGNGIDETVLRQAGADKADVLVTLTEGDNRNVMAAQIAKETFKVPKVIAKINDPIRAEAYEAMDLITVCRTTILGNIFYETITGEKAPASATMSVEKPREGG